MKVLRLGWACLALGFVLYFVATRWETVVELQRSVELWQPIASLILIISGKLFYTKVVYLILATVNVNSGFHEAFYAYNISQLGKYIPGSIWQFIGRHEIYRRYGISSGQAFQFMALETILMLSTAL
jgi:hypothetical protein